jgi:hypothetical protein
MSGLRAARFQGRHAVHQMRQAPHNKEGFNFAGLLKFAAILIAAGVVYYFFRDTLMEFIRGILRK